MTLVNEASSANSLKLPKEARPVVRALADRSAWRSFAQAALSWRGALRMNLSWP